MNSFQETVIAKVVELLGILRRDYCSKEYIQSLLSPSSPSLPPTPVDVCHRKKPYLQMMSSNQLGSKPQKKRDGRKPYSLGKPSPKSNWSKPTNKRVSVSKTRNRSLKAVSAKTQKKKPKFSKSHSRKRKNQSGSPDSSKDNRQRYMNALKYVNPQNPGRFWLTGTLGKAKKHRKARKKSNSLNMNQNKKKLSLSNLRKEDEELESVWGCRPFPRRQSKIKKVPRGG